MEEVLRSMAIVGCCSSQEPERDLDWRNAEWGLQEPSQGLLVHPPPWAGSNCSLSETFISLNWCVGAEADVSLTGMALCKAVMAGVAITVTSGLFYFPSFSPLCDCCPKQQSFVCQTCWGKCSHVGSARGHIRTGWMRGMGNNPSRQELLLIFGRPGFII